MGRIRSTWIAGALLVALLAPSVGQAGARFDIDEDSWISLGAGLRPSASASEDAAPSGSDYSKDLDLESFRLYIAGQIFENLQIEFNAEYDGNQEVRVLDGVIKLALNDMFNLWAGRFLPPSDRANLSGPYYLNSFDFPFAQAYPAIFAGRDEGIAYWGQAGGGMFKWQFGAFEGTTGASNDEDSLLYAGRLVLNLWDPEPGYYNSSTYYGEKDILAIGLVGQLQEDGAGAGMNQDFRGWNVDFLLEKKLDAGVVTLEGAYYDYDRSDVGTTSNEGESWFAVASFLFPQKIGSGTLAGQLQPILRYQEFDPEQNAADEHTRWDFGVNYIIDGHNARLSFVFSRDKDRPGLVAGADDSQNLFKVGLQIQL